MYINIYQYFLSYYISSTVLDSDYKNRFYHNYVILTFILLFMLKWVKKHFFFFFTENIT